MTQGRANSPEGWGDQAPRPEKKRGLWRGVWKECNTQAQVSVKGKLIGEGATLADGAWSLLRARGWESSPETQRHRDDRERTVRETELRPGEGPEDWGNSVYVSFFSSRDV